MPEKIQNKYTEKLSLSCPSCQEALEANQTPQFLNMVWIWNIILYKTTYILNLVFINSIVDARVFHKKLKEAKEMDK